MLRDEKYKNLDKMFDVFAIDKDNIEELLKFTVFMMNEAVELRKEIQEESEDE